MSSNNNFYFHFLSFIILAYCFFIKIFIYISFIMDMMKPEISVIIPVYNVEPYLKRCLDSIVNQSMKEIEIIVVQQMDQINYVTNMQNLTAELKSFTKKIAVFHTLGTWD